MNCWSSGRTEVASFNELQQRLNRKAVTARMLEDYPAFVHLYDILFDGAEDLRPLHLAQRRSRLEAFYARERPSRMDVSPLVEVAGLDDLERLRGGVRGTPIEGLMLKRKDSPYLAGRPKGHWWKWKRDAQLLDVVLMYAQRGHGKRSSFYSDFTFGAWRDGTAGPELVPVGKAYSGYTDAELLQIDRWIRDHTIKRYGPVREVTPALVLEVAFDSVAPLDPPQVRRRDALSPHPPDQVGQAGGGGGSPGDVGATDRVTFIPESLISLEPAMRLPVTARPS